MAQMKLALSVADTTKAFLNAPEIVDFSVERLFQVFCPAIPKSIPKPIPEEKPYHKKNKNGNEDEKKETKKTKQIEMEKEKEQEKEQEQQILVQSIIWFLLLSLFQLKKTGFKSPEKWKLVFKWTDLLTRFLSCINLNICKFANVLGFILLNKVDEAAVRNDFLKQHYNGLSSDPETQLTTTDLNLYSSHLKKLKKAILSQNTHELVHSKHDQSFALCFQNCSDEIFYLEIYRVGPHSTFSYQEKSQYNTCLMVIFWGEESCILPTVVTQRMFVASYPQIWKKFKEADLIRRHWKWCDSLSSIRINNLDNHWLSNKLGRQHGPEYGICYTCYKREEKVLVVNSQWMEKKRGGNPQTPKTPTEEENSDLVDTLMKEPSPTTPTTPTTPQQGCLTPQIPSTPLTPDSPMDSLTQELPTASTSETCEISESVAAAGAPIPPP